MHVDNFVRAVHSKYRTVSLRTSKKITGTARIQNSAVKKPRTPSRLEWRTREAALGSLTESIAAPDCPLNDDYHDPCVIPALEPSPATSAKMRHNKPVPGRQIASCADPTRGFGRGNREKPKPRFDDSTHHSLDPSEDEAAD